MMVESSPWLPICDPRVDLGHHLASIGMGFQGEDDGIPTGVTIMGYITRSDSEQRTK